MHTQYTDIVLQLLLFLTYRYQFECSNLSFFFVKVHLVCYGFLGGL